MHRRRIDLRADPSRLRVAAAALLAAAPAVWAQGVVETQAGRWVPTLAAEAGMAEVRSRPDGANGREAVARVMPGLRWVSGAGPLQGDFDYAGSLLLRRGRGDTEDTDYRSTLNAHLLAEVVRGWGWIDTTANITQQAVSPFGQQTAESSVQDNPNRAEVRTVSVAPYARGGLGGFADYEVRFGATHSSTRGGATPSSRSGDALFRLESARGTGPLGWSLSASHRRVETSEAAGTGLDSAEEDRVRATLALPVTPQFRLTANGGAESIDEGAAAERRDSGTGGAGFEWAPSMQTRLSAEVEKRYFGRAGRANFVHRGPSVVWSYTFTRDTTFGIDALTAGRPTTLYDVLYLQTPSALDQAARDRLVRDALRDRGLDPNELVPTLALTSAYSLQQRQDLTFAWLGRRLSIGVAGFTLATSRFINNLDGEPVPDEPVRQHGYSSTVSYRLTPETTVSFGGSRRMTFSTSTEEGNDLKTADLGITSQVGRRTTASLTARYTVFNSSTEPYRETSLFSTLSMRF